MDVSGKFTMDDMDAVDKYIGMVKRVFPKSFPDNPTGKIMQATVDVFCDMLDLERKVVLLEAEQGLENMVEYFETGGTL